MKKFSALGLGLLTVIGVNTVAGNVSYAAGVPKCGPAYPAMSMRGSVVGAQAIKFATVLTEITGKSLTYDGSAYQVRLQAADGVRNYAATETILPAARAGGPKQARLDWTCHDDDGYAPIISVHGSTLAYLSINLDGTTTHFMRDFHLSIAATQTNGQPSRTFSVDASGESVTSGHTAPDVLLEAWDDSAVYELQAKKTYELRTHRLRGVGNGVTVEEWKRTSYKVAP